MGDYLATRRRRNFRWL